MIVDKESYGHLTDEKPQKAGKFFLCCVLLHPGGGQSLGANTIDRRRPSHAKIDKKWKNGKNGD